MRKLNRKAVITLMLSAVIGLVLLVIILGISTIGINSIMSWLGNLIGKVLGTATSKAFNPDSVYTQASDASFDRLNYEINELLKDSKDDASIIIPYTLGQYRLVGFNKEALTNNGCIDDKMIALKGHPCADKACLCLCKKDESCSCTPYAGVNYFVTIGDTSRNKGSKMVDIVEPFTGEDAYCLYLKGACNEAGWKASETFGCWWHSYNIMIKKEVINGKTAIFISRVQDLPGATTCDTDKLDTRDCDNVLSCFDYLYYAHGCEWQYFCQNNICPGSGLSCGVLDVPATDFSDEDQLCAPIGKALADICTVDYDTGLIYGETGQRVGIDSMNACYECNGYGSGGNYNSGWIEVPGVASDACTP